MVTIRKIDDNDGDIEEVRRLFREYLTALNEDLCFQSFDVELENPLKKYGEPRGALFLAFYSDQPAGCIALQPLAEAGVCEMKRLYVRTQFRNKGIGDELIKVLLQEAEKKGYKVMVLDTLDKLQQAIQLYGKYGFENTSAYYENPLENVLYMKKDLKQTVDPTKPL